MDLPGDVALEHGADIDGGRERAADGDAAEVRDGGRMALVSGRVVEHSLPEGDPSRERREGDASSAETTRRQHA